jgi:hypothetical protein
VPIVNPVATPDDETIVATDGVCTLHVPPVVTSIIVTELPRHILQPAVGQDMVAGNGFTVNVAVAIPLDPAL